MGPVTAEQYGIGELVVVNKPDSRWHGAEVTITGPLHMTASLLAGTGEIFPPEPCYSISCPWHPGPCVSPPRYLRKRRPPQDWAKLCALDSVPAQERAEELA